MSRMKCPRHYALCSLIAIIWAAEARAQIHVIDIAPSFAMAAVHRQVLDQHTNRAEATAPEAPSPTAAPDPQRVGKLSFTPSQTRRKANYAAFVAKTRAQDPAGAAQLEQLFATVDVVAATEAPLAKLGLSSRNVADAYAAWWVTAWLGAQGRSDDPTRAQMQAVKRQTEAAFAATPQAATMTDAQKQEFAEALLVQAALLTDGVEQSQGNPAQLEAVKAAIRQGAKVSGMDLDTIILTEDGFVPA